MSKVLKVPEGWEVKPLKDILTIKYGKDQKEVEALNGKYPILGSGGVIGYTNHFLYDKPSVLIGRKGTINNPQYMETPFWTVDTLFYSHIKNNNVPKWVYYVFQSINWYLYNEASGVPSLSTSNINRIKFLRPSTTEQQKIAKILSTLDKTIEATAKFIDKEKNIKKGLMHDLLTNGIDSNNKIRTQQTHPYKQSELGLIPEEWEIESLQNIGTVTTGNTPPTDNEDYYNGNIQFIGPVDFNGQKYIVNSQKYVSKNGLDYSREIPANTIITVCIGSTIGKLALTSKVSCTNQQINALVCKEKYYFDFVFYSMNQHLQKQLEVETGLQAVPIVNKSAFSKLILACPQDNEEQKQIAKILTTQDKKIQTEETNLAKLKELKKGLMNDLLSGKVRVRV